MEQPQKQTTEKMTGFRKRQQLMKTNKSIFAWVAGASVIVTVCVVLIQFLVQQLLFNQQIITEKTKAQTIVIQNKTNAPVLKQTIDELVANSNLAKVATNKVAGSTSSNLQVILDALPTSTDGATFANSLSKVILPRSGVSIESIDVDSASESATTETDTSTGTSGSDSAALPLGFSVTATGNYEQIQNTLSALVRVIRPISVTRLTLQGSGVGLKISIGGVTYSVPATTVDLQSKVLP